MNHRFSFSVSKLAGLSVLGASLLGLTACSGAQSAPATVASSAGCNQLGNSGPVLEKLYQPGGIVRAEPIEQRVFKARAIQPERTMGASLFVRAEPNMNAPYLQRVLACHADSSETLHPNDPLHPQSGKVTEVSVREAKNGFAVDVLGENPRVGAEIWQRASTLTGKGSVEVQQVARTSTGTSQL